MKFWHLHNVSAPLSRRRPRDSAATPTEPPLAPADTAAPAVPIYTPAPIVPKIDAVFINARFGDYLCIVEKKKDFKGKA